MCQYTSSIGDDCVRKNMNKMSRNKAESKAEIWA